MKLDDSSKINFEIGRQYVIRTVTMIFVGTVKKASTLEIVLEKAAWVPSTCQWSRFLNGEDPNGMEPYPMDVTVPYGCIVDYSEPKNEIEIKLIKY